MATSTSATSGRRCEVILTTEAAVPESRPLARSGQRHIAMQGEGALEARGGRKSIEPGPRSARDLRVGPFALTARDPR